MSDSKNRTTKSRKNKVATSEVGAPTRAYSGGKSSGRNNLKPAPIVDK